MIYAIVSLLLLYVTLEANDMNDRQKLNDKNQSILYMLHVRCDYPYVNMCAF